MKKFMLVFFTVLLSANLFGQTSWSSPPQTLSTLGVNASAPQIVIDPNANITAVWLESTVVIANTLPSGGSWGTAVAISSSGASAPQIAVDPSGNVTAVWVQSTGIHSATLPSGGSWSSATTLSAAGATAPQVAVDPSGDAAAVWESATGFIQASTKLFGGIWSIIPSTISGSGASAPMVSVGGNGNVVVVWQAVNGSINTVYSASKIITALTWGSAAAISSVSHNAVQPTVFTGILGNAVAGWFRYDVIGSAYKNVLFDVAFLVNGTWLTSVDVSTVPGLTNPANLVSVITIDSFGNALAAWTNSDDGSNIALKVAELLSNGTSTGTSELVLDTSIHGLDLSSNSLGYTVLAYMANDTSSNLAIQTLDFNLEYASPGWNNPNIVSQGAFNGYPQLASTLTSNTTNNYALAWIHFDGTSNVIQAVTGTETLIAPPTSLTVTQTTDNRNVVTEYYNTLSWTASTDPNVDAYLIFRNGVEITAVSVNQYIDYNRSPSESVVYTVAAIDNLSNKSVNVNITFP